jgi:hypothetical protein
MEEKRISEKESLEIITEMISRTKDHYIGDGNILMLWGYLTVVMTAVIWALLALTHNGVWNWLWFAIWIVGGIVTPIMARKNQRRNGVKSYSDKISSSIWSIVGYSGIVSTLCCLGFLLLKGVDCWSMMFAFALIIVPFAEMAQGIVVREKSFLVGGGIGLLTGIFTVCCIAGGITLEANWFLPLFIVAFIFMMIVPGHILNSKYKRQ